MKFKIYLLAAVLTLSLSACSTTNDPLEVKIDEALSKNNETENKTDVNNDLHVDNSVENVENYPSNSNPDVENSPDSGISEEKISENHDSVKDSDSSDGYNSTDSDPDGENPEKLSTEDSLKVENLTPDDIFYVDGVPHIKAVLSDGEPETSEYSIHDLKSRFENATAVVLCEMEGVEQTKYFDRNKMPIKLESLLPKSNSFQYSASVFENEQPQKS